MKELSYQAQVGKHCRTYLKSLGIKCRVKTGQGFTSSSAWVTVFNQNPDTMKTIESYLQKYEYDDYSNNNKSVSERIESTVTYLHIENDLSDDILETAFQFLKNNWRFEPVDNLPETYAQLVLERGNIIIQDKWGADWVRSFCHGFRYQHIEMTREFWAHVDSIKGV